MTPRQHRLVEAAPGVIAVATVGFAALAGIFGGGGAGAAVAVVGWLLLTPLSAILGDVFVGDDDSETAASLSRSRSQSQSDAVGAERDAEAADPVERLRQRYAAGDIDDVEFEQRLDTLLETEDADAETARERLRERNK
ncbi:SHOCT domain-containing protein [Halobaculum sp. D14]|uniref:SHOCT domain-containing protein n=1 Tax=Halobaculum sp. D14 TaxID=3421642 RepID=UPI003EBE671B